MFGQWTVFLFLEEETARARKECISSEEQTYLCHLLSLERLSPKQQLLLETAEQLYGKKVKEFPAKSCANFEAGEHVPKEKALNHFRKKMEHCHFSITQLSLNMGKLAGNNHSILSYRVINYYQRSTINSRKVLMAFGLFQSNEYPLPNISASNHFFNRY